MSLYERVVLSEIRRDPRLVGVRRREKPSAGEAAREKKLAKILKPLGLSVRWEEVDPDVALYVVSRGRDGVGQLEAVGQAWELDADPKWEKKIKQALKAAGEKVK